VFVREKLAMVSALFNAVLVVVVLVYLVREQRRVGKDQRVMLNCKV
jgi:energy-converting hydrogenase Eha subunit C